jgi:hypothetical protein
MEPISFKNSQIKKTPFGDSVAAQRPTSALLAKFKDNPANRGLILKESYEAPKNKADAWVLC